MIDQAHGATSDAISDAPQNGQQQSTLLLRVNSSIQVARSGLIFPGQLSLESWEVVGRQIFSVAESSTWWIADWLVYGEEVFKDRYQEAIKKTNLTYQTLRNYVWVARQFEQPRRRDELSFGHHAEVAALEIVEQDYWLRKSQEHAWSRNRLRREVRESLRERKDQPDELDADSGKPLPEQQRTAGGPAGGGSPGNLTLDLSGEQATLFRAAAARSRLPLSAWAIKTLEAATQSGAVRLCPASGT